MLKNRVDKLFEQLKSRSKDPLRDKDVANLNKKLADVQKKVKQAKKHKADVSHYTKNWNTLLETHKAMKHLQNDVKIFQGRVKKQGLDSAAKGRYYGEARKIWNNVQACWNDNGLRKLSTWIEITSTKNFQYFNSTLDN